MTYSKTLTRLTALSSGLLVVVPILLLAGPGLCLSQVYYVHVDSAAGDRGTGSYESPYNQLSDINWPAVSTWVESAAVEIRLKRGSVWNERLAIGSSGTSRHHIKITAYGTGDLPKIFRSQLITNNLYEWTQVDGTYWYIHGMDAMPLIWEDGNFLTQSNGIPGSPGYWYYDEVNSRTYYYPTFGNPSQHILSGMRGCYNGIEIVDKDYIDIEYINIEYCQNGIWITGTSDHVHIDHCEIDHCWRNGIYFRGGDGHSSVTNCTLSYFGDSAIYLEANAQHASDYTLVANNKISYCNYANWSLKKDGVSTRDGHAVGIQSSYNIIRDNMISHTGSCAVSCSPWLWQIKHNVICGNVISDAKQAYLRGSVQGQGFNVHEGNISDYPATKNIIYQNVFDTLNVGVKLIDDTCINNKVFNNTFYDCDGSIYFKNADKYDLKNNLVSHSDAYHIDQPSLVTKTGNILNYNHYYSDGPLFRYRGGPLTNFATWQATSGQDRMSRADSDPMLTGPSYNEFTLESASPCIDAGTWLATITSPTGAYQALFRVSDPFYFHDGFGLRDINGTIEVGQTIMTEGGEVAVITGVDYTEKTLTVSPTINIVNGQGIALSYTNDRPDIGAKEFSGTAAVSPPNKLVSPPNKLRLTE